MKYHKHGVKIVNNCDSTGKKEKSEHKCIACNMKTSLYSLFCHIHMRTYKCIILLIFLLIRVGAFSQSASHLVYFESNTFTISGLEHQRLIDFMETFQHDSIVKVRLSLIGRTDSMGTVGDNAILAEKRINAVMEYVRQGQKIIIIEKKNAGELEPLHPNKTEAGRKQNRSVEIIADITTKPSVSAVALDTVVTEPIVHITITPAQPPIPSETFQVLKKGRKIRLKNIGFIPGSVRVNAESISELNELLWVMHNNPTLRIEIRGHVCCENDRWMSIGRARTVREYLTANSIDEDRMKVKGFGNKRPINLGLTQKGKQRNRRVEIKILEI